MHCVYLGYPQSEKACIFTQRAARRLTRNGLLTAPAMTPDEALRPISQSIAGIGCSGFQDLHKRPKCRPLAQAHQLLSEHQALAFHQESLGLSQERFWSSLLP